MSKIIISSGWTTANGDAEDQSKRVKYVYADDKTLTVTSDQITVGNPPELIIGDLHSGNSTIVENVTNVPSDYYGDKYDYDSGTWTKRSDWNTDWERVSVTEGGTAADG